MKENKIKSQKEIEEVVKSLKRQGKKVVIWSGSFDLLHSGHVKSLEEAKAQGDVLVILLNSDASIQKYKSVKRPIIGEEERASMLAALQCVDFVVLFDETNPKALLEKIQPDVYCNGADWGKNCVERSVIEKYGGKIYVLKWKQGLSTSKIIAKILDAYANPPRKAIFIEKTLVQNKEDVTLRGFTVFRVQPSGNINTLSDNLLTRAKKHTISLSDSWVIGESDKFVLAGREVNAKTVKIGSRLPKTLKIEPHYYAANVKEAMKHVQDLLTKKETSR